jgi:cytoskeletal protein RodZ
MPDTPSIGQMLRKHREERGLTPEQAAHQSRVPLRLLQALEADDYRLLPDPAYLTRLLHEYALLLGLDPKALQAEFRSAIRRPPGGSLVAAPPQPPPLVIPWKQVLWTAGVILIVTPLVFIALSLASKRVSERLGPPHVAERPIGERSSAERGAATAPEPFPTGRFETVQPGATARPTGVPALPVKGPESARPTQQTPTTPPASPQVERKPRRLLLAAHGVEPTWMAVRSDEGQERRVLLEKGQTVRFVADKGFLITVGNAGGVELSLNGKPLPSLGKSGQVVRDLVLPSPVGDSEGLGTSSPGVEAER